MKRINIAVIMNLIFCMSDRFKLLVFLTLILLNTIGASSLAAQGFQIGGSWKYIIESKKEFSKPEYNDSHWAELETLRWKDDVNRTANRELWVRKRVVIPSSLKAEFEKTGALTLSMGKIQQSDETYLNGKLIGSTGSGDSYRNYLIRKEEILWDQENVIAIKVRHWGTFSVSKIPELIAALPEHFFVYGYGLKNGDSKAPVLKKDLLYELKVTNRSVKSAEALVKADFYDFSGSIIYTTNKKVLLAIGENVIGFPYNSPSSFVKVVYSVSIPDYNYTGVWNAEFGYENIVYQSVDPIVAYKARQNYFPAGLNAVQVNGWLGEKLKVNTEKRLHKVDEDALLAGFINRPGSHSWIGEHIGKFLEAACNAYANNGDPMLKIQIDRSVQQLIAAQLGDGYLGTYQMDSHWTSWDVWSHKYNLVGLLRYYELSGFKPALTAAEKIGDILANIFGDESGKRDIISAGAHVGMAATSVLDPMTDLYRFTGNQKYLDFCYYLIKSYNNPRGPRIISTLDSLGRVDKVANAKAYEMLTNLVGIAKLYRITNDEQFLKPVVTAWTDIVANRLYITGTASSFEHFHDNHVLPAESNSNMGEGCVTTTWIQFNYQLFSIFGEMKYLDELERTASNHLTGAEDPQTGGVSYYTPLMGRKPYGKNITCCMSSVPRGIAMIPLFANGTIGQTPTFLLYQPGTYKTVAGKEKTAVEFITHTQFPADGKVSITVIPSRSANFRILLRKPYWADDFTITVNGAKQESGSDVASIERTWEKGDKIEIRFKMPVKVLDGNISYPDHIALQRGSQILVFDQNLNKIKAKDISLNASSINPEVADSTVLPKGWVGTQAYLVNAEVNGTPEKVILVPYADAGQTGGEITTWIKKKI
jgi:DUF1680 family protein